MHGAPDSVMYRRKQPASLQTRSSLYTLTTCTVSSVIGISSWSSYVAQVLLKMNLLTLQTCIAFRMFTTLPVFCFKYFIQPTKAGEVSSHTYFEPSEMVFKQILPWNLLLLVISLTYMHIVSYQFKRIISSTYIRGSSMLSPTYAKAAKCITTLNVFLENTE